MNTEEQIRQLREERDAALRAHAYEKQQKHNETAALRDDLALARSLYDELFASQARDRADYEAQIAALREALEQIARHTQFGNTVHGSGIEVVPSDAAKIARAALAAGGEQPPEPSHSNPADSRNYWPNGWRW